MAYINIIKKINPVIIIITFLMISCTADKPTPALIDKAKVQTMSIIDSLNRDSTTIIGDVDMISEYFDEDKMKYVINYEIETGLDSASITDTKGTVFIEKTDGKWNYNFVFNENYKRDLSLK